MQFEYMCHFIVNLFIPIEPQASHNLVAIDCQNKYNKQLIWYRIVEK